MLRTKTPTQALPGWVLITSMVFTLLLLLATSAGKAAGSTPVDHAPQSVVTEQAMQAAIDQRVDQVDAQRDQILTLLRNTEVQRIAGAAGLDLQRANAAAATLTGPTLESLAAQASTLNDDLSGGDERIVITTTGLIIILLVLILLL